MHTDLRNFAVIFTVGIVLVSVAVAIQLYPRNVISNLENNLNSGQLSQQDIWAHQGALTWWRIAQQTIYFPLASIINYAGLSTLALSIVYAFFALIAFFTRNRKSKSKSEYIVKETEKPVSVPLEPDVAMEGPVVQKETLSSYRIEPADTLEELQPKRWVTGKSAPVVNFRQQLKAFKVSMDCYPS